MPIEIVPFHTGHLPEAAALLAHRHASDRRRRSAYGRSHQGFQPVFYRLIRRVDGRALGATGA